MPSSATRPATFDPALVASDPEAAFKAMMTIMFQAMMQAQSDLQTRSISTRTSNYETFNTKVDDGKVISNVIPQFKDMMFAGLPDQNWPLHLENVSTVWRICNIPTNCELSYVEFTIKLDDRSLFDSHFDPNRISWHDFTPVFKERYVSPTRQASTSTELQHLRIERFGAAGKPDTDALWSLICHIDKTDPLARPTDRTYEAEVICLKQACEGTH